MTNSSFGGELTQSLSCRTTPTPLRCGHRSLQRMPPNSRKRRTKICGKRFTPDFIIPLLPFIVIIMYSHYYNSIKERMKLPCWGSVITPRWIWKQLFLPLLRPSHSLLQSNHRQTGLCDHSAIVLVKNEGISTTGIFTKLFCGSKVFERRKACGKELDWLRRQALMMFLMLLLPHMALFQLSLDSFWLSFLLVSGGLFPITSNDTSIAGCYSNWQWHYCHAAHNYVYDFTHKTMQHMEAFVFPLLAMWL